MALRGAGLSRQQAAGISYPATQLRSGQVIGLPTFGTASLVTAVAADVMYAYPIPVPASGVLNTINVQVGTLTAGVNGKLGIARPGPDGFPLTLLAECPAAVDFNAAAGTVLAATITGGLPVGPSMLWGLFVANGAAQPALYLSFNTGAMASGHLIGNTLMSGYTQAGATASTHRLSRAHTYAAPFPATLTGWTATFTNPGSPILTATAA
jgi:hypothetical protein